MKLFAKFQLPLVKLLEAEVKSQAGPEARAGVANPAVMARSFVKLKLLARFSPLYYNRLNSATRIYLLWIVCNNRKLLSSNIYLFSTEQGSSKTREGKSYSQNSLCIICEVHCPPKSRPRLEKGWTGGISGRPWPSQAALNLEFRPLLAGRYLPSLRDLRKLLGMSRP